MAEYVEAKTTTRIAIDPRKTMPWHDRQFIRVGDYRIGYSVDSKGRIDHVYMPGEPKPISVATLKRRYGNRVFMPRSIRTEELA